MRLRLALCLLLLLSTSVWAQDLTVLTAFDSALDDRKLVLTFQTSAPVESAVYFKMAPDKLVVELIDTDLANSVRAGAVPRCPGVSGLRLRQLELSRVQCEVDLDYRLPLKNVETKRSGTQLTVTAKLDYELEDSLSLSKAVRWVRRELANIDGYLLWNELSVNLQDPQARLEVGLAKERLDAREKPSSMIERYKAVAAVNGGYFNSAGGPLGLVVKEGKILSPHVGRRPPRTTLGVSKDRKVEFEQAVAKQGSLASRGGTAWSDIQLALGGGPRLVHRGQLALTTDEEELGPKGNDITRECARTAVATTRDGKVLIVTASGYKDNHLHGVRLEELAAHLVRRGCQEAMNLDGGSSTSMSIGSQVVSNGPAGPRKLEKEVATALLVMDERGGSIPERLKCRLDESRLAADGSSETKLTAEVLDDGGKAVPDGTIVRFYPEHCWLSAGSAKTEGGQASVQVRSICATGPARIRVECAAARDECSLRLDSGPAARLFGHAGSAHAGPFNTQEVAIVAHTNDAVGNSVGGVTVTLTDPDGQVNETGVTGGNGSHTFLLKLPLTGARLTLRAEGLNRSVDVTVPPLPEAPGGSPTPAPALPYPR